jgi:hypothetical protein
LLFLQQICSDQISPYGQPQGVQIKAAKITIRRDYGDFSGAQGCSTWPSETGGRLGIARRADARAGRADNEAR